MKGFYIVLLVVASLVSAFCLAAAVTAQASFTWWKAEKGPNGTKEVYFGLYRICTKHTDQGNEVEKCHRFDETGITEFLKDNTLTTTDVNIVSVLETNDSRDVWIMSFFHIVLCGLAFLISVPVALQSMCGNYSFAIIIAQVIFTFSGCIIGIACVAFGYARREDIWSPGLKPLVNDGLVTNKVTFEGRGFLFETLSVAIMFVPFLCYAIVAIPIKNHVKTNSKIPDFSN